MYYDATFSSIVLSFHCKYDSLQVLSKAVRLMVCFAFQCVLWLDFTLVE